MPFRRRRARPDNRFDYCTSIFHQRLFLKGEFSNRDRDIAVLVELELDAPRFHFLHGFCRIVGYRPGPGIGH